MQADVTIIGAGLAGCSIAWHLRKTHKVVVIDQAETPGSEASSQNAGMLRRLGEDPYERRLAQRTHLFLEHPHPDWEGLTVSRKSGALMLLAQDPHHLEDALSHLRALKVSVQEHRKPGEIAPYLQKQAFVRAYFLPEEHSCDPKALLLGFVRGAKAQGVDFKLKTQASSLVWDNDQVIGVNTSRGRIYSDKVVLAAGAWSSQIAADSNVIRPLTPLRRAVFRLRNNKSQPLDSPWVWVDDVGIYAKPTADGFLISPCDEHIDPPLPGHSSWGRAIPSQHDLLHDKLQRYFPGLLTHKIEEDWTGLRTFAPDRRPILGPDKEANGLLWAAGLGGFGLSCCVGIGEAIAAWIRDAPTEWLDPRMVSPNRGLSTKWLTRPDGHIHRGQLVSTTTGFPPAQT